VARVEAAAVAVGLVAAGVEAKVAEALAGATVVGWEVAGREVETEEGAAAVVKGEADWGYLEAKEATVAPEVVQVDTAR